MNLTQRIEAFSKLGNVLMQFLQSPESCKYRDVLNNSIIQAEVENPWFTRENILYQMQSISETMTADKLSGWLEKYNLGKSRNPENKVAVIMAGNIPLVGFYDFLAVLITGNHFIGKLSSKDQVLLKTLAETLKDIAPEFVNYIRFEENIIKGFDSVIATGSNNASVYFQQYFSKFPHIIRKNRNSIAVLSGYESESELRLLADDTFLFFGLGCRNVSKIMIPENYSPEEIIPFFEKYTFLYDHNKYANNYQYNKTLLLMNSAKHLDSGFFLMKEDLSISSPVSVIYFEFYKNLFILDNYLKGNKELIQCIVSNINELKNSVKFGQSQRPQLNDYSDNIDTIEFLTSLKR